MCHVLETAKYIETHTKFISQTKEKEVIRYSGVDTSLSWLQQIITQPRPSCTTDLWTVELRSTAEVHHLVIVTAKKHSPWRLSMYSMQESPVNHHATPSGVVKVVKCESWNCWRTKLFFPKSKFINQIVTVYTNGKQGKEEYELQTTTLLCLKNTLYTY